MADSLPTFERPPLIETVLGVQFAPLKGLSTAHIGLFWGSLGGGWREGGETEALGQVVVDDRLPGARFGELLVLRGHESRLRFCDASGTRLLQIENGWIVYNWRRQTESDLYPRFAVLVAEFIELLAKWRRFLQEQQLADIAPSLWEVSYINAVERGTVWESTRDWATFLPALVAAPSLEGLGAPLTGALRWRFALAGGAGTLEVTLDHLSKSGSRREAIRLSQTARGRLDPGASVELGLRDGHAAIVRAFAAMSSETAQQFWGRKK